MSTFFTRIGRWPYLVGAAVSFVVANLVILGQVRRFEELTGGLALLEVPRMVTQDLYVVAAEYPTSAVTLYRTVIQPLDVLYPLTLGLLLVVVLSMLTVRLFPPTSRWRSLPWLGALPTLADWSENVGVFTILRTIDDPIAWVDPLTRLLTAVKGIVAIGTVLVLAGVLTVSRVRDRGRPRTMRA